MLVILKINDMEINMASLKTQMLIANDQAAESQEELSQMVCFLKNRD